ncbi:MAG: hypothetical protein WBD87_02980 [Candidatus Acidiferrales bacterium]
MTETPASGTINGNATQIIPSGWFASHFTDNTNWFVPVVPTITAFPSCSTSNNFLQFTTATGKFGCGTSSGSGVSSVGLSMPGFFTVSGSPVTSTGTLTAAYATGLTSNENQVLNVNAAGAAGLSYMGSLFDTNGFAGVQLSTVASAVNAETVLESATGSAVEMIPGGSASDSSIEQLVSSKGGGEAALYAPGSGNAEAVSVSGDVILNAESSAHHVRSLSAFVHSSEVVTFSATPAFAAGQYDTFEMTLTGNVTSSTISSAMTGERISFTVCQNSTGGFTFAWPTGFRGAGTIGTAASTCSSQLFWYDGTSYFAISTMVTGE